MRTATPQGSTGRSSNPSAKARINRSPRPRSALTGSIQTNRYHAIQVECWGFAAKMGDVPPEVLNWLADRVLAPVARLVPINLDRVTAVGGEFCYGKDSSCRMSAAEWQAFDGVTGHQRVPDNSHWYPGALKLAEIAARARVSVGGGGYIRRERLLADHDGPGFEAEGDDPWAELEQLAPPSVPASFVPPVPPRPTMTRRPQGLDRPCCLLAWPSLTGLNKLGRSYDSSQPGILYTGGAGFVDLGHLWSVAEVTAYAYQHIYAGAGAAGTKVPALEGDATLTSAAPKTEWLELARSIAYDDALAHGIVSYRNPNPGGHNSSFSPEDLCSNYLGTVVASGAVLAASATARSTFAGEAEDQLRMLLVALHAQSDTETTKAFELISRRWVDVSLLARCEYLRRRNFSPVPWPAGHPSDTAPPAYIGAPFKLTCTYDYRHGSGFGRTNFGPLISAIRLDAASLYGPNYDRPSP